jgi:uncharacterized protein YqeY
LSDLKSRLRADLNEARRARDKLRTLVLGTTLAELKNHEIALGREAGDSDVVDVVTRAVKKRREAAEQIRAGGREELAAREEQEAEMLGQDLPQQLTEPEVRAAVRQALGDGARSVGEVMSESCRN